MLITILFFFQLFNTTYAYYLSNVYDLCGEVASPPPTLEKLVDNQALLYAVHFSKENPPPESFGDASVEQTTPVKARFVNI